MKFTRFFSVAIIGILMVVAVGCTTMQPANDQYETTSNQPPARIYVEDPYHYGRTIVMDRDPVSGRYYQVNPYSGFDPRYDSRYYSNSRYYDSRYYDSRYDGYSRGRTQYPSRQSAPTPEQDQANDQKRKDAASVIFGKKQ